MKPYVLACVLAAGVALTGIASAQDSDPAAEARTQYQLGTQAFQAKKYAEAATHFEAAAAARSNAVALYTAGLAWDLAGKNERAADAYARALDVPGLDAKQSANAKDRVAALEKTLGTVAVQGPEGWKVQLEAGSEAPVPVRLHAPSGSHALAVKEPGKPVEHRDVML
jgi:tetratricopeptide (TPR) repeat protein